MKKFGYTNHAAGAADRKDRAEYRRGRSGCGPARRFSRRSNDLTAIAGQKAVITRAKKAIATFKIRAGLPIGVKVTLRKDRMYEFLDRLITMALPRVRDFRGVSARASTAAAITRWA